MKIVSICDDEDISTGLRLAGIEGAVVQTPEDFLLAFAEAASDEEVGLVVVSKSFAQHINWDSKKVILRI